MKSTEIRNKVHRLYFVEDKKGAADLLQQELNVFDFDDDDDIEEFFKIACLICINNDIGSFDIIGQHPGFDINMVVNKETLATDQNAGLFANLDMLKILVERGLDVGYKNSTGNTLQGNALKFLKIYEKNSGKKASDKCRVVVDYLSESLPVEDLYVVDSAGMMPFHKAASIGAIDQMANFLKKGFAIETLAESKDANLSVRFECEGKNALHIACALGEVEAVNFLLSQSANPNAETSSGYKPLFFALANKSFFLPESSMGGYSQEDDRCKKRSVILTALVKYGADINAVVEGRTPLLYLFRHADLNGLHHQYETNAIALVELGADVNMADLSGLTPLHLACMYGCKELIKTLLSSNANINVRDINGTSPLHHAVEQGDEKIVKLLLKKGADSSFVNNNGDTALSIATKKGYTELVEMLLTHV